MQREQENKAQHILLGRYYIHANQTGISEGYPVSILSLGYLIKRHNLHGFSKMYISCGSFFQSFPSEIFHNSFIACTIFFWVLCCQRALAQ